ncbi:DNA N-6-adenine-methyltransferase [Halorientalis persicus]|nr:DNA N-6-adenine-methyltransferase [Halorientalis persicus]
MPGVGGSNERGTPRWLARRLSDAVGGFDLDPATRSETEPFPIAEHRFTPADNGLKQDWFGAVYVNPPFERGVIDEWAEKIHTEANRESVQLIVCLIASTGLSADWFEEHIADADYLCALNQRLSFSNTSGSSPFAPLLAAFGAVPDSLLETFDDIGTLWERHEIKTLADQGSLNDIHTADGGVAPARASAVQPTAGPNAQAPGVKVSLATGDHAARPIDLGELRRGTSLTIEFRDTLGVPAELRPEVQADVIAVDDPRTESIFDPEDPEAVSLSCVDEEGRLYAVQQNLRHLGDITVTVENDGQWDRSPPAEQLVVAP